MRTSVIIEKDSMFEQTLSSSASSAKFLPLFSHQGDISVLFAEYSFVRNFRDEQAIFTVHSQEYQNWMWRSSWASNVGDFAYLWSRYQIIWTHNAVDEFQIIAFYFWARILRHYFVVKATCNSIIFLYACHLTVRRDSTVCYSNQLVS